MNEEHKQKEHYYQLASEAYALYDRLHQKWWDCIKNSINDVDKLDRLDQLARKALSRYERRYLKYQEYEAVCSISGHPTRDPE